MNRARFFLLVGAIGAIGCENNQRAVSIPSQPTPSTSSSSSSAPSASTVATSGDASGVTTANEDASAPPPVCGWVDPQTVHHRSGPGCAKGSSSSDDNPVVMDPPHCRSLAKCDDFSSVPPHAQHACEKLLPVLKLRVDEETQRCLLRLSSHDICDPCNTHRCIGQALKSACLDPAADATCVEIRRKCPSVAMDECRDYLSGMKPEGRSKMLTCVSARCGFGLYACVEGL